VLGEIENGILLENQLGKIVLNWYKKLPERFNNVILGDIQLMPNHIHVIIEITPVFLGRGNRAPTPVTLGRIVAYWKYNVTKEINCRGGVAPPLFGKNWAYLFEGKFFQRNYYERVVRNEVEWRNIEEYMENNPKNWLKDKEHPKNIRRRLDQGAETAPLH
jgi:putative transposase